MLSEQAPVEVDDLPGRFGFRPKPLDQPRIVAVGDEADVLAVGLGRDGEPGFGRDPPHFVLGQVAEREAQEVELLARGSVEEIALVAAGVGALVELRAAAVDGASDIVPSRQAIGAKLAREGDQVGELHPLVAQRAGDRGPAAGIFLDELIDHPCPKAAFVVEHIVGDSEPVGDGLGIVDVLPGTAGARAAHRFAVVVELQRHADHLGAGARGERGRDRTVDAAGHGDDDSCLARRPAEIEADGHRRVFTRISLLRTRPESSRGRHGGTLGAS